MRTRRPISINNSLVHGICNYSCKLCGVNKPTYRGPREFQSRHVTECLIRRVREAACLCVSARRQAAPCLPGQRRQEGIRVRYIANSGDGEATLHPEFGDRMDMFGDMIRTWDPAHGPAPEVSVVTNGSNLVNPDVLDVLVRNPLTLIVSFPTSNPESYGELMMGSPAPGPQLLQRVITGMEQALRLCAQGKIRKIEFHIAPPDREIVRRDFPRTIDFLTTAVRKAGSKTVSLILFPATSNRSGLVRNRIHGADMYRDLFRAYHGQVINEVKVEMKLSYRRFFPRLTEMFDLLKAFDYPCIWNSQLFITASGDSICCNDQAVRNPMGNILDLSVRQLIERKEEYLPGRVCAGCDQSPACLGGSVSARVFGRLASWRLAVARGTRCKNEPESREPGRSSLVLENNP